MVCMWAWNKPSGQSTQAPSAVERDALSGRGSNLSPGASAYQKELFQIIPMHMTNRKIILGRKKPDGVCYKLWPLPTP